MKHSELKELIREEIISTLSEEKIITKDSIKKKATEILKLFGKKVPDASLIDDLVIALQKFISSHKNEMGTIKENYSKQPIMMVDLEPGVYEIRYKYDEYNDGEIDFDTITLDITPELIETHSDKSIYNYIGGEVRGFRGIKNIKKIR